MRVRAGAIWIGAAALIGVVIVVVRSLADVAPEGDLALLDIRVLGVVHGWQATGAYSRFGWDHPGPLYLQLLAPLYWLSGYRQLATVVTAAIINGASLAGLGILLARRSAALFVAACVIFAVYLVRMDGLIASTWNPHVGILPLALLIGCVAELPATRSLRLLPICVLLASFVIQAHVGFAAPAVAAVVSGLLLFFVDRDAHDTARDRRSLVAAIALAAIVWALPVADALRPGGQHNLQHLASFFRAARPADPRRASRAFETLVAAPFTPGLRLWDTPLAHSVLDAHIQWLVPLEGLCFVASAIWWSTRDRRRFESRIALVLAGTIAAAFVAIRRLPEAPQDYTVLWVSAVGVLTWVVIASVPIDAALAWNRRRGLAIDKSGWVIGVVAAVLVLVLAIVQVRKERSRDLATTPRTLALARLIEQQVRAGGGTPLIRVSQRMSAVAAAVVLQLYRSGVVPAIEPGWESMFGVGLAATGHERITIAFADTSEHLEDWTHRVNFRQLGQFRGMYVYVVDPEPESAVVSAPIHIEGQHGLGAPARLFDGVWSPATWNATSADAVPFLGPSESVTFAAPTPPAIGLRLWGEPDSVWLVRCAGRGSEPERIGQVRIGDGPGTQRGDAFLRALPQCRHITISPSPQPTWHAAWLSEVQLLMPASPVPARF